MDLIEQLELENGPLSLAIARLGELVRDVESGEREPSSVRELFLAALEQLREQLLQHFGREEECFFPFFSEVLPEMRDDVDLLEAAHDRISGSLSRLLYLAGRGHPTFAEHFGHIVHVFRRFEVTYSEHARSEGAVLRRAADALTADQLDALVESSRGLI